VSVTTDHSVVDLDEGDRPTQSARPPRDDRVEDRRDLKQAFPARVVWVVALATLAVAGVAAAVGLDEDATGTSADRARGIVQVGAPGQGDTGRTELDVRGIPTWWSGERPAAEHGGNPPIGSTASAAAAPSVLDVRGIPTWWSGEVAAVDPLER
jgi:hypothetical protein